MRAVILFFEVFAVPVPAVIVPAEPELVGTSEFRSEPERGTGSVPSLLFIYYAIGIEVQNSNLTVDIKHTST